MIALQQISNQFVAHVSFPFTNFLYNRRQIRRMYTELMANEQLPPERLVEIQLQRLLKVLKHAARWVPFYRENWSKSGFDPNDVRSLDDLKQIPALSRSDLIEHYRDLVDRRYQDSIETAMRNNRGAGAPIPFARFRNHRLVRNTSSGSTGAPTVFFEDGAVSALNWAIEMRHKRWFGVSPGAREARTVRLSTDYIAKSCSHRYRQRLWHQLILPGINLGEEDYEYCLNRINEFKPEALWGFTGALTGLADHIKRTGRALSFQPKVVIGWAAPVYDHEKALLQEVFNCPCSNLYSAREVGHIALQCPEGRFHVNQEYLLVETDQEPGSSDQQGEVLVTTLIPTPMPFIRYRMGDLAQLTESTCSCGRTLQVLDRFIGRTGEIFITRDKRMISPNFWCRLFMAPEIPGAVQRFQVKYTRQKNMEIKLVKGDAFNGEVESYLHRTLIENFHPHSQYQLQYVDRIDPEMSGKYRMVYHDEEGD